MHRVRPQNALPSRAFGGTTKAVIVSLDLIIASALASIGILLLLASVRASQSYLLAVAEYQNRSMETISASQEIASAIDSPDTNISVAVSISNQIAGERGLVSRLDALGDAAECHSPQTVCRLVTVSGSTYLLVISNESPSQS
jgi:hypothetical protein